MEVNKRLDASQVTKSHLLNEGAVKSFLDEVIRQNRLMEAPGILMTLMGEELQLLCAAYAQPMHSAGQSVLIRYAHLSPNNEQIRCALIRLLSVPADKGTRPYRFFSPRQWLCVFKVLSFLGILQDDYGCMAHMEAFIRHLFEGQPDPRVRCVQDSLTKKNIDRPFSGNLQQWEQNRESRDMHDYWPLALLFLQFLAEECVTDSVSDPTDTEVNAE